jgi:hypothetical protein
VPAVASGLIVLTPSWLMSAPGARNPAGSAVPHAPETRLIAVSPKAGWVWLFGRARRHDWPAGSCWAKTGDFLHPTPITLDTVTTSAVIAACHYQRCHRRRAGLDEVAALGILEAACC